MIRNLETLGLALMAVLAMSAVAPSATSAAAEFHSETAPIEIVGEQATKSVFHLGGKTAECTTTEFTGTQTAATAVFWNLTSTYGGCKAFGFANAHVNSPNCEYIAIPEVDALGIQKYKSTPSACDMTVTPTFFGVSVCTVAISPTLGYPADFATQGTGTSRDVLMTPTITELPYAETSGGSCKLSPSSGSTGAYTGTTTFKGFSGGKQVGISVEPAPPPEGFHSEGASTKLAGEQATKNVFHLGGKTVECSTANFAGTQNGATAAHATVVPTYSGCSAFGYAAAHVSTAGCKFTLSADESTLEVTACPLISITPTFLGASACTVYLKPGAATYPVDLANQGSGSTRDVLATWTATTLPYEELAEGGCGLSPASGSTGAYTGTATFKGSSSVKQVGIFVESGFHSEAATTEIVGEQSNTNILHLGAQTMECTTIKYTGTQTAATAASVTFTPTYSGCKAFGFASAHVNPTDCEFTLAPVTATTGNLKIQKHKSTPNTCGVSITPTFFGTSVCTVTVSPNPETNYPVDFTNQGAGASRDFLMTSTINTLPYAEAPGGGCSLSPSSGSTGAYTGTVTFKGFTEGQVGFWTQ